MIKPWDPYFYQHFPGFESLSPLWQPVANQFSDWPEISDYNVLAKKIFAKIPRAFHVAFTSQESESFYEWQIYQERLVPTREASWHDFFNNLTWLRWPKLKSALIKRLCEDSLGTGTSSRERSPLQNLLTQLDEFGAIICCDKVEIINLIKTFQWQTLFLETPNLLGACQCTLLGHGLFEKLLDPFLGLTAKAIFLQVKSDYFRLSYAEQLSYIDQHVAAYLLTEDFPKASKALQPFPILGWPNWYPKQNEDFYGNKAYFREHSGNKEIKRAHFVLDAHILT